MKFGQIVSPIIHCPAGMPGYVPFQHAHVSMAPPPQTGDAVNWRQSFALNAAQFLLPQLLKLHVAFLPCSGMLCERFCTLLIRSCSRIGIFSIHVVICFAWQRNKSSVQAQSLSPA